MRSVCIAEASHIFSTKNIGIFQMLTFKISTNDDVSFEQPGPDIQSLAVTIKRPQNSHVTFKMKFC